MVMKENLFDLTGHTALVTGGGYGLGRGLVHGLAAHGATVIGLARSENALRETRDVLLAETHPFKTVVSFNTVSIYTR